MDRGEVWWADLSPPVGRRPVLLLARSRAYAVRTNITVAPVTTRIRHLDTEVSLGSNEGMPRDGVVSLEDITTIPLSILESKITTLTNAKLEEVEIAIHVALGLSM